MPDLKLYCVLMTACEGLLYFLESDYTKVESFLSFEKMLLSEKSS